MNHFRNVSLVTRALITIIVVALNFAFRCWAHDPLLHVKLTESAFMFSEGLGAFLSESLGSQGSPFTTEPTLLAHAPPFDAGMSLAPLSWLRQGAYYEDMMVYCDHSGFRSLDHFYTLLPRPSQGLSDWSDPWYGRVIALPTGVENAFKWASQAGILGPFSITILCGVDANTETYQNARTYEYLALTSLKRADREENLARTLFALGHVLHLNQDMSQPEHVRNDSHFSKNYIEKYGVANYRTRPAWFTPPPASDRGWTYWRQAGFTKLEDFWDRKLYTGYLQNERDTLDDDARAVPGSELGLAEFSNANFLGEDALYEEMCHQDAKHRFPFPSLYASTTFPQLIRSGLDYDESMVYRDGTLGTHVYIRKSEDGVRVSHHSRLTYLEAHRPVPPSPQLGPYYGITINDPKVLEDYHSSLLPKAIKYSGGILDYFFRGKLEVVATGNGATDGQLRIINHSGTNLMGGSFTLLRETANGDRSIVPLTIVWSGSSRLEDGLAIDAVFTAQTDPNSKFILVYRGTVGSSGTTPNDPLDSGIAVAAAGFIVSPTVKCDVLADVAAPPSVWAGGTFTMTTESFAMPAPDGTVTVNVDNGSDAYVGDGVIVDHAGEFEIVNTGTFPYNETITLKAKDLVSQAAPGTVIPAGTVVQARLDPEPWKAVYVPSVNRIFINASFDMILVVDPVALTLESYFHVTNIADDYALGLVYAADVDRLYLVSSYGGIYRINPTTLAVDHVIPWPGSSISTSDGFYDPVYHRVGFGYTKNTGNGLVFISTSDDSVAADFSYVTDTSAPCEYSSMDNRVYAAEGALLRVYSASDLALVATIYTPGAGDIWLLRYSQVSREVYGFQAAAGAFYIDCSGTHAEVTTGSVTAPVLGSAAAFLVGDTSGMIAGQPVTISGVQWQITSAPNKTSFQARNLSVAPGVPIPSGVAVTWEGPKHQVIPSAGQPSAMLYAATEERILFSGYSDTKVFNPVAKSIDCTMPNPQHDYLEFGCDAPNGRLFIPFLNSGPPWLGGVRVME